MTKDQLIAELVKALEEAVIVLEPFSDWYIGAPKKPTDKQCGAAYDLREKLTGILSGANATQSDEWQPIETAPKDGTPIIIATCGKHGWYIDCAENWFEENGSDVWLAREDSKVVSDKPTHWRPLPSAPVKQEDTK